MSDYGRPLEFGYFLVPNADDPLLDTARAADRAGLDLIGVQDHPYQRRYVDTWTLLSTIAAVTERVRVFPDVASLPLRPPAVLAKAAASLDVLSGGAPNSASARAASGTRSRRSAAPAARPGRPPTRLRRPSPSSGRCGAASATSASTATTTA